MCGEKAPFLAGAHIYHGSPPRVRGKEIAPAGYRGYLGITPACAGKSFTPSGSSSLIQDHPRVCGEKFLPIFLVITFPGSPPRVRGKVFSFSATMEIFLLRWRWIGSPPRVRGKELVKTVCNIWDRITPACAGKSPHAHPQITQNKDHPRVCGEKIFSRLLVSIFKGSPPRVRGKVLADNPIELGNRITPACAGKRVVG